jgi:hypothetical protein
MIECHNHDKIMDSLFDDDNDSIIVKPTDGSKSLWRWLLSIMRW